MWDLCRLSWPPLLRRILIAFRYMGPLLLQLVASVIRDLWWASATRNLSRLRYVGLMVASAMGPLSPQLVASAIES